MGAIGSIEVSLEPGGDFELTPQGDLLLVVDTLDTSPATIQRLQRLIYTNPTVRDYSGNPIGRADDLFHPAWGAGAPAAVGSPITPRLLFDLQSQIQKALAADPYIATNPPPVVNVLNLGDNFVQINVTVSTVTGQLVTIPSINLQVFTL